MIYTCYLIESLTYFSSPMFFWLCSSSGLWPLPPKVRHSPVYPVQSPHPLSPSLPIAACTPCSVVVFVSIDSPVYPLHSHPLLPVSSHRRSYSVLRDRVCPYRGGDGPKVVELHHTVQSLFEEEEALLNLHMNIIQVGYVLCCTVLPRLGHFLCSFCPVLSCLVLPCPVFPRDVYGVRIYMRSGFLRSGSIKPHCFVRFVAADIRSVTIRDFFPTSRYPIRSAPCALEKIDPLRDIFKGGYPLRYNP